MENRFAELSHLSKTNTIDGILSMKKKNQANIMPKLQNFRILFNFWLQ